MADKSLARNSSIDIMRYFFAVLVVLGHANPFRSSAPLVNFFTRDILTRMAVPYFLAVAGYFYIRGLESGRRMFASYAKKLLGVYAFWSAVYMLEGLALDVINGRSLAGYGQMLLREFFLDGARYQLWFFPVLFFSVAATTLAYRLRGQKAVFCVATALFLLVAAQGAYGAAIPGAAALDELPGAGFVSKFVAKGLGSFMIGYLLNRLRGLGRYRNGAVAALLAAAMALFIGEACLTWRLGLALDIDMMPTLYLAMTALIVFLFNHPLPQRGELARISRLTANFTYYAHPLVIDALGWIWLFAFGAGIGSDPKFFLTWIITTILGVGIARWNNARVNRVLM